MPQKCAKLVAIKGRSIGSPESSTKLNSGCPSFLPFDLQPARSSLFAGVQSPGQRSGFPPCRRICVISRVVSLRESRDSISLPKNRFSSAILGPEPISLRNVDQPTPTPTPTPKNPSAQDVFLLVFILAVLGLSIAPWIQSFDSRTQSKDTEKSGGRSCVCVKTHPPPPIRPFWFYQHLLLGICFFVCLFEGTASLFKKDPF